jgi:uncharacterized protein YacL
MVLFLWIIIKYFITGKRILSLQKIQDTNSKKQTNSNIQKNVFHNLSIRIWSLFGNCQPGADPPLEEKLEIGNFKTTESRYIVIGLICSMVAIIVHGLVDVPYFKNDLSVMFWIFMAMMGMIHVSSK